MINLITITGVNYEADDGTKKYVIRKIGRLDRYIPRHARKTASAEIVLRFVDRSHGNKYEAEAIVHIPGKTLTAKDSTVNMLAAVDIVEAKLAAQLHKYKTVAKDHTPRRGMLARLKGGYSREAA